CYRPPVC
uniref:Contryphan Li834 n=1 Tax=Conus lividus TaxID=89426 RepID=COW34_CONLI|nr:RecName: Full=Contryphan Li834 [Conus lividus]